MSNYCILLAADTPLFAHVKHAYTSLDAGFRKSVKLVEHDDKNKPNDVAVAGAVSIDRYHDQAVLAGICDPYCTNLSDQDIRIEAHIVKRLGFCFVASPDVDFGHDTFRYCRTIWAHGPRGTDGRAGSSAQALAGAVKKAYDATCAIEACDYGTTHTKEGDITITANLVNVAQAMQQRFAVKTLPDLFPEWSRLLLSALISKIVTSERRTLLERFLIAVHDACYDFRTDAGKLQDVLKDLYSISEQRIAKTVAEILTDNRFIPNDVIASRLTEWNSRALWSDQLHRAVLFGDRRPEVQQSIPPRRPAEEIGHGTYLKAIKNRSAESRQLRSILGEDARQVLAAHDGRYDPFINMFRADEQTGECKSFVMSIDIRKSTDLMFKAKTNEGFVHFIRELCDKLKDEIVRQCGVFDKFTGDGILAFFPAFYSELHAGHRAIKAATECHLIFDRIYNKYVDSFKAVPDDTGLGIGIDFGETRMVNSLGSLTVVGHPVVFACRLSDCASGKTLLNKPAHLQVCGENAGYYEFTRDTQPFKNDSPHRCFSVTVNRHVIDPIDDKTPRWKDPAWRGPKEIMWRNGPTDPNPHFIVEG